MIVAVSLEHHFDRTPDGRLWTQTGYAYAFWQRYLEVFDGVRIVSRVRDISAPSPKHVRADGPRVTAAAVPDYVGPWQYLAKAQVVRRALDAAVGPKDAVILRVPSHLGNCLFPRLRQQSQPFAVEVIGDPWDVFGPHVVTHPLRPFFRRYFTRQMKRQCRHACGAAYVTEHVLQQRYPIQPGSLSTFYSSVQLPNHEPQAFSVGVSDVELAEESFLKCTPRTRDSADAIHLLMVGSLAQLYKGPDVAIQALAVCVQKGLNPVLTIVGDGHYRGELERQAMRLGLADRVLFRGQLSQGKAVQAELDRADLFIMPSRTEGLPRAMIEAMARGLPCIGSAVGGIPELLPPEDLFPPGNAKALAAKIHAVVSDPLRMHQMSECNLRRSRDFSNDVLRDRRTMFYRFVCARMEAWLARPRNNPAAVRDRLTTIRAGA